MLLYLLLLLKPSNRTPKDYAAPNAAHPALAACVQLEEQGHLRAASPDSLALVVAALDPARLVPYEKGDPGGIVQHIDAVMGVRPKPR
jgi:hypothetical protein